MVHPVSNDSDKMICTTSRVTADIFSSTDFLHSYYFLETLAIFALGSSSEVGRKSCVSCYPTRSKNGAASNLNTPQTCERAEMFMGPMFMGLITMNISSPHRRLVTMNN